MTIFVVTAAVVFFWAAVLTFFANRIEGREELMYCDDCKKTLEMVYDDGVFKAINLSYEWED